MRLRPLDGIPVLHGTPLPLVSTEGPRVTVRVDDEQERRLSLTFSPYQGLRVTAEDCFALPSGVAVIPRRVVVVEDSPWLAELAAVLERRDPDADFMERSHHFLIQAGDKFIEVAAWSVAWEGDQSAGSYPVPS